MSDTNVEILNDVLKKLIDSRKGYEKMIEVSDDSYVLRSQFQLRLNDRKSIINDFQNQVRALAGEPETEGSLLGAAHRGFTEFSSLFRDDEKAALDAVDDGEEHLAEHIESKLEDEALLPDVRELLFKAHASAKSGERFADSLDD